MSPVPPPHQTTQGPHTGSYSLPECTRQAGSERSDRQSKTGPELASRDSEARGGASAAQFPGHFRRLLSPVVCGLQLVETDSTVLEGAVRLLRLKGTPVDHVLDKGSAPLEGNTMMSSCKNDGKDPAPERVPVLRSLNPACASNKDPVTGRDRSRVPPL
ncbi:unnamed protein product [Pleuronectes platessa]|uniref:Uncharacterized protein n=1 Tax=Pleuronectes platessa TaxID=8262 RepID=A0A9N7V1P3_PLEPL|nr:unnamed protein product [Pleuronectes platessa]